MSPWQLRHIARFIRQGEIVAYPTEAVFGLGCNPFDADCIERLLALKQRPVHKGLILVGSSYEQLTPLFAPVNTTIVRRMQNSWPGPITWLVPAADWVPYWLTGNSDKIAVRVSAHPVVQQICAQLQFPIVSTSANVSNRNAARNAIQVRKNLGNGVAMIVNERTLGHKSPSKILDSLSGQVIRA